MDSNNKTLNNRDLFGISKTISKRNTKTLTPPKTNLDLLETKKSSLSNSNPKSLDLNRNSFLKQENTVLQSLGDENINSYKTSYKSSKKTFNYLNKFILYSLFIIFLAFVIFNLLNYLNLLPNWIFNNFKFLIIDKKNHKNPKKHKHSKHNKPEHKKSHSDNKEKNINDEILKDINIREENKNNKIAPNPQNSLPDNENNNKLGFCYVGTDRGYRSCIEINDNDKCISGDIFPTKDVCINPNLRYQNYHMDS